MRSLFLSSSAFKSHSNLKRLGAQDKNSRKLFLYTDNAVTGENISVMIPAFTTLKPSF